MEWWEQSGRKTLPRSSLRSGTPTSTSALLHNRGDALQAGFSPYGIFPFGLSSSGGWECLWRWSTSTELGDGSSPQTTHKSPAPLQTSISWHAKSPFFNLTYHLNLSFSVGSFGCKLHQGSRISLSLTHSIPKVVGTLQSRSREPTWC